MNKVVICLLYVCTYSAYSLPANQYPYVCFSPNVECRNQIINEIQDAKKSIKVQAYSFTDINIAHALINASKHDVNVKVIFDKSNKKSKRSVWPLLKKHHISIKFDCSYGIAHNKVIIIDDIKIITGSYNFSSSAYKANRENLLILNDKSLADRYIKNFNYRWNKSR